MLQAREAVVAQPFRVGARISAAVSSRPVLKKGERFGTCLLFLDQIGEPHEENTR
jgi:hypothetical protein